jgi:hypothetical protein
MSIYTLSPSPTIFSTTAEFKTKDSVNPELLKLEDTYIKSFAQWIILARKKITEEFVDNGYRLDKLTYSFFQNGIRDKLWSLWYQGIKLGADITYSTFSTSPQSDIAEFDRSDNKAKRDRALLNLEINEKINNN